MSRKEYHIGDGDRIRIESPFPWGLVIVVVAALLVVGAIAYIALSRNSFQPAAPQPIPISVAPPTATTPVPATPPLLERFVLELAVDPQEAADLVINPGPGPDGRYDTGAQVKIEAAPKPGWLLREWVGVNRTSGDTAWVTMHGPRTVTAKLVRLPTSTPAPAPEPKPTPAPKPVAKPTPAPAPISVVTFPDSKLEAAIRQAVNKRRGTITAADLASLTVLDAGEKGIADLTGIEYCVNLTGLNLYLNQITDISPLASLTNLTVLGLSGNQISDIFPLASLTNLTTLYLWNNQISDISPLEPLTNLVRLNLSDNQFSDISLLASLTNLTVLRLSANQISDISPLVNLTKLTELNLRDNQISDISLLASLTNLTDLTLYQNQISDISPLVANSGLARRDTVDLRENTLDTDSLNTYIPQLKKRGVRVQY